MNNAFWLKIQIYVFHFPHTLSLSHTHARIRRNAIHWSATATIINLVVALDYWINQEPMLQHRQLYWLSQLDPVRLSIQFMNIQRKKWPSPSWISIVVAIIYGKCVQNMISLTDIRQMHGNFLFRLAMVLHGAMYSKRPAQRGCTISIYWASAHIIFTFVIRQKRKNCTSHTSPFSLIYIPIYSRM